MAKELVHADKASQETLKRAVEQEVQTVWDRYEAMQPSCKFGSMGICCRLCNMGPCRLDPRGLKNTVGVCGANYDTIVARNLVRMIAGGAAAHSDHGRDTAHTLLLAATDPDSDYQIKDPDKLKVTAEVYGIKTDGRDDKEIAADLARACLDEFGQQEGNVKMASTAPEARQKVWKELGIYPRAIDREIVEVMHRTHMGVDTDFKNIIRHGMRTAHQFTGFPALQ